MKTPQKGKSKAQGYEWSVEETPFAGKALSLKSAKESVERLAQIAAHRTADRLMSANANE